MIKVGFTGTQVGMTEFQKATLKNKLIELIESVPNSLLVPTYPKIEFHHGDCVGSDEQAHYMALELNLRVIVHPPEDPKKRAFCRGAFEYKKEKPYLDRNHDIVDETDCLLATPKCEVEELRSGTWATYRYAKKMAKKTGKTYILLIP